MKDILVLGTRKIIRKTLLVRRGTPAKKILKSGYAVVDGKPVHRIIAEHYGIVKPLPKKEKAAHLFDIIPNWVLLYCEKPLK